MKKLLIFLHAFVGIGALFGGGGAVLNPNSPMGISVNVLKNSPFIDILSARSLTLTNEDSLKELSPKLFFCITK